MARAVVQEVEPPTIGQRGIDTCAQAVVAVLYALRGLTGFGQPRLRGLLGHQQAARIPFKLHTRTIAAGGLQHLARGIVAVAHKLAAGLDTCLHACASQQVAGAVVLGQQAPCALSHVGGAFGNGGAFVCIEEVLFSGVIGKDGCDMRGTAMFQALCQFASGVVSVFGAADIEAGLLYQAVTQVVSEGGDIAVFVGQHGQAARSVVFITQPVAQGIHPLLGLAQGVQPPVGIVAQGVAVGDEPSLRVVGKALHGTVRMLHGQQTAHGIDLVAHGLAFGIGDCDEVASRVIAVLGGLAGAVGIGEQLAGCIPLQALGGAMGIPYACGAVRQPRIVVEVMRGVARFIDPFGQAPLGVVEPAAGMAQWVREAGDFTRSAVILHTDVGTIGRLGANSAPEGIQLIAGFAAHFIFDSDELAKGAVFVGFAGAIWMGDACPALAWASGRATEVVGTAAAQAVGHDGGLVLIVELQCESIDDFAHHAAAGAVVVVCILAHQAPGQSVLDHDVVAPAIAAPHLAQGVDHLSQIATFVAVAHQPCAMGAFTG